MSTSSSHRLSGGDEKTYLRHYPSTPHLDTLRANKNTSTVLLNAASNLNLSPTSYMPKTTLSTFASHGKSKSDVRFRDDPNPYKVSEIEKYRIKVHDPYVPKSHHRSQQGLSFYTDDSSCNDNVNDEYPKMEGRYFSNNIHRSQTMKSSNSHRSALSGSHTTAGRSSRISSSTSSTGDIECEIPEPDYDDHRSTAGSSEDIPIPLPESSCSEEYSSVSAGSDPDHYNLEAPDALNTFPDESSRTGEDSGVDTPAKITEKDRMRIEYALKGRKTTVYVSDSLANLYVMKKASGSRSQIGSGGETDTWDLKYTGVPVLLLDSGETKSRDKRRIQIVLAEFGTGLALWKDVIDNLTNYKATEGSLIFHTMHLSSDHTKIIGLSFDDEESAVNFSNRVDKLTSDFANISLSGSKTKAKNKKDKSKGSKLVKYVKPKKSEISQPCCFTHVSSLSSKDRGRLSSLQHFIVPETFSSNRSPSSNIESSSVSNTSLTIPNKSVTSSGSEISF